MRLWAHIQLADPVTWIAPIAMVLWGAISSGRGEPGFHWRDPYDLALVVLVAVICGPFCTGFSQSINDYYDRDLDAINDPARPIPSGRVSLCAARLNWVLLGVGTMALSLCLIGRSIWIPVLAAVGLALSAAYSVPPIKLKQHYWMGPPAVGFGYVFLCWLSGHLCFAPLTWPSVAMALINSVIAAALLFLNDIKSIEGDRRLGLKSMTVALGARRTLLVSFLLIGGCEIILLGLALLGGYTWATLIIALALLYPLASQIRLYREPSHTNFRRYIVANNPLILLIEFVSAFIVGGYFG